MMHKAIPAVILVFLFGGCTQSSTTTAPAPPEPRAPPAAAPSAAPEKGAASVTGKLPPALGGFPSILILQPEGPAAIPPETGTPYMDQLQQTFIPPVLMVRTGQPVEFRNGDEVLHNVRVGEDATHSPAFNVAIPTGEKYTYTFQRDGFYDVGCDIHPAMSAQIIATGTPFTAVADSAGNFEVANVPAGAYKAIIYAGTQTIERELTVVGGSTTFEVDP